MRCKEELSCGFLKALLRHPEICAFLLNVICAFIFLFPLNLRYCGEDLRSGGLLHAWMEARERGEQAGEDGDVFLTYLPSPSPGD